MSVVEFPRQPLFEEGISGDEAMRRIRAQGGKTTDGVIDPATFSHGWAKTCFKGEKVHYWRRFLEPVDAIVRGERRRFYPVVSLCGLEDGPDNKCPLLGGGNYPRCKRCAAKAECA